MMEYDNKYEECVGQNDPELFMVNNWKMESNLGHPAVIAKISVQQGS